MTDPSAQVRTRQQSVGKDVESQRTPRAIEAEYTAKALYTQLKYLTSLADVDTATKSEGRWS